MHSAAMRFSVTLDGEAYELLVVRAAGEQRSTASMAARLIRDGLGVRLGVPAAVLAGRDSEPAVLGGAARGGQTPSGGSRPASARTQMCEHRVPSEQFCTRCDS